MTDTIEKVMDAVFEEPEEKETKDNGLDLSNKGLAKLAVQALAANGISKATTSAMKTFGFANDIYGKNGQPSFVTRVQIGVASMYVSRIITNKVAKMVDSDIDKLADIYVELRDSFKDPETKQ